MGKDWYQPQESPRGAIDKRNFMGEKTDRREGTGIRSLRQMRLDGLSSTNDLSKLNQYLDELRNAIYNWQIDGDKVLPNTISSTQVAHRSIAGSCLGELLEYSGLLWVHGSISADRYISAASGFFTHGDLYANNISANGNVSAGSAWFTGQVSTAGDVVGASGEFHSGINTSYISCIGTAQADYLYSLGGIWGTTYVHAGTFVRGDTLSAVTNVSANDAIISNQVSAAGDVIGASGEFHSGINTSYMSCTGVVEALSIWPQNGWTGSFTVNAGANTCYVSAGIITGVV